ncbi:ATP-dependent zinc protease family protein [Desulfotalea psychrophila]|nr:RimK/LysX family protein [Desulfotalea psychrophila]
MVQIRKAIFGWQRIVMLLLVPVLLCSCTLSRPDIEAGVKPAVGIEAKPAVGIEAKPAVGIEAKPAVGIEAKPAVGIEVKPAVGIEVKPGPETGIKPVFQPSAGLRLIGEVEPVTLIKSGVTMPARIDTGATTSSLDAKDIRRFERDGEKWVRFMVRDRRSGQKKEMKCRLSRNVTIKRHGEKSLKRPVVTVKSMMGGVRLVREFSLADRSDFAYQILIGRNFLQGEFVVDVNRKNVTTPMSEKQR